ncbi:MAG: hypothetical protein HY868_23355 [Chloroflexi bacterium]|nr:hypothetical protein [Chloroflexota bacterium]
MKFDYEHSELERDSGKLHRYVQLLENALGDHARVVGILEIGSFAKGEAVPTSDIDTRVFVTSPTRYFWQAVMGMFSAMQLAEREQFYTRFVEQHDGLPRRDYTWSDFNQPVAEKIAAELGANIEFGIADARYAEFEFERLDESPMENHSFLFQSNIIHDPHNWLSCWRARLRGQHFPILEKFYRARYLDELPAEVYWFLKPDSLDYFKLKKSRQIQWVKWAVRCLRDAAATRVFIATGDFIYKKPHVLAFYRENLPDDFGFVAEIYAWKTDVAIRDRMVDDFARDASKYFALFRERMPRLEAIVQRVGELELG